MSGKRMGVLHWVEDIMLALVITAGVMFASSLDAYPCDYGLTDKEMDSYLTICPYGDAVIELKKSGERFDVQCVNYNPEEKMWEFMVAPSFKSIIYGFNIEFKRYKPADVIVYTQDGTLTVEKAEADLKSEYPFMSSLID